ncbi:hypothetical protein [Spirosoma aerolatum]|uniref:hypothetical protein n=1 Tax=Spirosoma aerolatum TaxID=1211326 RepID=UPI0009AE169C|nr:hypothetical protein [Spirosoma aerolatum]
MVCHREIFFENQLPSIEEIVKHVSQRTGLEPIYDENDWSLTNPHDEIDSFGIYYDESNQIVLTNFGSLTYLLGATLHTLIAMGGKYDAKPAQWPTKKWSEVAEKVKSLPRQEHPDWVFD